MTDRHRLLDLRAAARWSSAIPIDQPPSGAAPGTATSPPMLTSTPQPVMAAATGHRAVDRERLSGRAQIEPRAGRRVPGGEPGRTRSPSRRELLPGGQGLVDRTRDRVVAVVSDRGHRRPTVGSTAPGRLRRMDRHGQRLAQQRADRYRRAAVVQRDQLGVGAKAAVRPIGGGDLGFDLGARGRSRQGRVTATNAVVPSAGNCAAAPWPAAPLTILPRRSPAATAWWSPRAVRSAPAPWSPASAGVRRLRPVERRDVVMLAVRAAVERGAGW